MRGTECGQQDAVLPENKEQGVLSSEVLAAPPTRAWAQPPEKIDCVRLGWLDAKGTQGPRAGALKCETRPSAAAAPGMHTVPWEQVRMLAAPQQCAPGKGARLHSLL